MPHYIRTDFPRGIDLYALLCLHPAADDAEVRSAYRRAALSAHPDRGGTKERFHTVAMAFEVLSCPASRDRYDRQRAAEISRDTEQILVRQINTAPARGTKRRAAAGRKAKRIGRPVGSDALELLRVALQHMEHSDRQRAVVELAPAVRSSLVAFMERCKTEPTHLQQKSKAKMQACRAVVRSSLSGTTAVIPIRGTKATRYQGQLQIGSLRFYTREHASIETAIDHQMILVQIRCALAQASKGNLLFWDDHTIPLEICKSVIERSGVPEASLRIRCFVQMRAANWLTRATKVTSPVGTLASSLQIYSRMTRARSTSWLALRKEWVACLQKRKRFSQSDAEVFADRARLDRLRQQMAKAAASVEKALARKRPQRMPTSQMPAIKSHRRELYDANMLFASTRMMGA